MEPTKLEQNAYRVFSNGAGVQSTAAMILQAQGKLAVPYDMFVFANVGEDSENKKTLEYYHEHFLPFAEQHGVPQIEIHKLRFGEVDTVLQATERDNRTVPIPVYMDNGGPPGNRSCTTDFKIRLVNRWIKEQGHAAAIIGIGFSIDERHRPRTTHWHDAENDSLSVEKPKARKLGFWRRKDFPLFDALMTRDACTNLIKSVGLPVPPSSKCWFCPFTSRTEWIEMKKHEPEQFQKAIELQDRINMKRGKMLRDKVWLHPDGDLRTAVSDQISIFDTFYDADMECQSGYCGL